MLCVCVSSTRAEVIATFSYSELRNRLKAHMLSHRFFATRSVTHTDAEMLKIIVSAWFLCLSMSFLSAFIVIYCSGMKSGEDIHDKLWELQRIYYSACDFSMHENVQSAPSRLILMIIKITCVSVRKVYHKIFVANYHNNNN